MYGYPRVIVLYYIPPKSLRFSSVTLLPLLGLAIGQELIKLILPEFLSYLEERGVLCVGNG